MKCLICPGKGLELGLDSRAWNDDNFIMQNINLHLTTASGRIRCLRCTAKSTRTKQQCGKPALKSSRTQKCGTHGGRSTGPKTAEGKARIAAAHTVHGRETNENRAQRSAASARLSQLEDAMHVLEITTATRIRGRKAAGYVPIRSVDDVRKMVIDDLISRPANAHSFAVSSGNPQDRK